MSTENKKLLTLKSEDQQVFEIDEAVAIQSQTIKHMVEDGCADNAVPFSNVKGATLAKIIEYLKKHGEDEETRRMMRSLSRISTKNSSTSSWASCLI